MYDYSYTSSDLQRTRTSTVPRYKGLVRVMHSSIASQTKFHFAQNFPPLDLKVKKPTWKVRLLQMLMKPKKNMADVDQD